MKNKLIFTTLSLFLIFSLVGCGKTMEDFEKEQYSLQEESISKLEESTINSSVEESIEDVSIIEDEVITPFDIVLSKYDFKPLVIENTFNIEKIEPADVSLFYDEREGFICKHNGILYMIPYLSETFGYDILDGANILKRNEIKEVFGITSDLYTDACVILGNKHSDNDVFAIFKIADVENLDKEVLREHLNNKLNSYISNKLTNLINQENYKLYNRVAATPVVDISGKYIFIVSLGENETKLNDEDIFEYFNGANDISTLRIADVVSQISKGLIIDNYYYVENEEVFTYDLDGMTWDEFIEHQSEIKEFEDYINSGLTSEDFFDGKVEEDVILDGMEVNDYEGKNDTGVY